MKNPDCSIGWAGAHEATTTARCMACGQEGPQQRVVTVANLFLKDDFITFCRCPGCSSLTAVSGQLLDYPDDELDSVIWRHYMQVGAGIDFMVRPLERVRRGAARQSLLDVGCGFGYTLDYWQRQVGGATAGVEPSTYGRMGRDMLGVPIETVYLTDAVALRGRQFDIVLSSEVIEHVPDPAAFLAELRNHVASDGTLVLTTPRADYVTPAAGTTTLIAALSPGLHKFLYSAKALEATLKRAGFSHVTVVSEAERLVAFAADQPLQLAAPDAAMRARYIDYLERCAAEPDQPQDLALGFRFRACKERVNLGEAQRARPHAEAFLQLVRQFYGYDPLSSAALREKVLTVRGFAEYGNIAPYCLGPFLFYHAMLERIEGRPAAAAAFFADAAAVLEHILGLAPMYAQEAASLVWLALVEQGCALLAAGHREQALPVFTRVENADAADGPLRQAELPEALRLRSRFEAAVALLQLRRFAEAERGFAAVAAATAAPAALREHASQLREEAEKQVAEEADVAEPPTEAASPAPSFWHTRLRRWTEALRR